VLRATVLALLVSFPVAQSLAGPAEEALGLVPRPWKLKLAGDAFELKPNTPLRLAPDKSETRMLAAHLQAALGFSAPLPIAQDGVGDGISLDLDPKLSSLGAEGYQLKVSARGLSIRAQTPAGIFYGIQTLRQLLPAQLLGASAPANTTQRLPGVDIEDKPRFALRGFMLDVGRHFFPKSEILRVLDLLALHKFNRFHWHLTEDQGWRVEIKKWPKLTQVGAWRDDKEGRYGGFYTQDELREVVAYAAERHITVVPEIEMPGHSGAALAAYPQLGCTGGPYKVQTEWGVHNDVFCPGKESTFAFIADVLDEVCAIFPSPEIHIGGDECPKERWHAHDLCQRRMKEEGLADEKALQSYFIKRVAGMLKARGRRMVGWDEICEGGLAEGATVQWWINPDPVAEAGRQGHSLICSNYVDTYLDQMHTAVSNRHLYEFQPYPPKLPAALHSAVLGIESPLWTEGVPTRKELDFQAFPRLCALAENLWLQESQKNYEAFDQRLQRHYARLESLGVNYRSLGRQVGSWGPGKLGKGWRQLQWKLSAAAPVSGTYSVALEYDKGPSNLEIRSMTVKAGSTVLGQVTTTAFAGYWIYQPELSFDLGAQDLSKPLVLEISAKGEKGPKSWGKVFLKPMAPPAHP
jgi:hexosaminidase